MELMHITILIILRVYSRVSKSAWCCAIKDWLTKTRATFFYPIRNRKQNQSWVPAHVFPRLATVPCGIYCEFWLVHRIVWVLRHSLENRFIPALLDTDYFKYKRTFVSYHWLQMDSFSPVRWDLKETLPRIFLRLARNKLHQAVFRSKRCTRLAQKDVN